VGWGPNDLAARAKNPDSSSNRSLGGRDSRHREEDLAPVIVRFGGGEKGERDSS
jgi:hypothetical protein